MPETYDESDIPISYGAYVKRQCLRSHSLRNLDDFLSHPNTHHDGCRVAALDFREGLDQAIPRANIALKDLSLELRQNLRPHDKHYQEHPLQGRILIIEDLNKDVVELLGATLDIDPLFFSLHLSAGRKNGMHRQTPIDAILPSRLMSCNFINLSYHRTITSDDSDGSRRRFQRDTIIDRKVVFLLSTNIGLVQHCVSLIRIKPDPNFWLTLMLVDPPIRELYYLEGQKTGRPNQRLRSQPFLGVCEDIEGPVPFSQASDYPKVALGQGLFNDLLQCWQRRLPINFNPKEPTLLSLADYPLKMVATEWNKYVEVMHFCLNQNEYQNDGDLKLDKFDGSLQDLQSWRRRSMSSQNKLESILRKLRLWAANGQETNPSLSALLLDFEYISDVIRKYGCRLESMIPVSTNLVQIADVRRSIVEASNVSRLTILALVFVPLNYVSSLFSMNDTNAPGGPHFWVYLTVAIPATMLVVLLARPPSETLQRVSAWLKALWNRPISLGHPALDPTTSKIEQA